MIIGDKELFATEFELDKEPDGYLLDGYFQYWIGGQARSEEYKKMLYLLDAAVQLEKMLKVNRENSSFFRMNKEKVFRRLCCTLLRGDNYYYKKYSEIAEKEHWWERFSIDLLNVESSSICYLIAEAGRLRLLVGTYSIEEEIEEYFISNSYFIDVLQKTCDQIFYWSEEEKKSSGGK